MSHPRKQHQSVVVWAHGSLHRRIVRSRVSLQNDVRILRTAAMRPVMRALILVAAMVSFWSHALAGSWISGAKDGVAIQGHDPVAYFVQKEAVRGKAALDARACGDGLVFLERGEPQDVHCRAPEVSAAVSICRSTAATAHCRWPMGAPAAVRVIVSRKSPARDRVTYAATRRALAISPRLMGRTPPASSVAIPKVSPSKAVNSTSYPAPSS